MFEDRSYLGTGWTFPPRFIKGKGIEMVSEEEDIRQSLHVLFSTNPGERIFRFDYGCNLHRWVFEHMDLSTETLIIDHIEKAILNYEPRIELEEVSLDKEDLFEGVLRINLVYYIRQTNNRSNMVYPYYFREGTNL